MNPKPAEAGKDHIFLEAVTCPLADCSRGTLAGKVSLGHFPPCPLCIESSQMFMFIEVLAAIDAGGQSDQNCMTKHPRHYLKVELFPNF